MQVVAAASDKVKQAHQAIGPLSQRSEVLADWVNKSSLGGQNSRMAFGEVLAQLGIDYVKSMDFISKLSNRQLENHADNMEKIAQQSNELLNQISTTRPMLTDQRDEL